MTLEARPLLSKFLPFLPLSFVIHGKASLWFAVDWFRWHLSIPQRRMAGSVFGDQWPFQSPKELAVHFSLLFVQPGATQFLCDLEMSNSGSTWKKKEAYLLHVPLKSEQRKNFRSKERTTFISLHALCTQCFARFSVSPTFLRANFWWIAPIGRR